jgi:hypothetical protein
MNRGAGERFGALRSSGTRYTGSPGRARPAPRSSPATSTPSAGQGCSSGCASCGPVTGSMSSTPTARWRCSASAPSTPTPRSISRYRRCTGPPPTRNCASSPAAGVRRGDRLVPEQRRRLRRLDPLTGPPGPRIPGRYLESRSAPTPLGNGRPVCAGIWAPPGSGQLPNRPAQRCPALPSQTRAHHRTGSIRRPARSAVAPARPVRPRTHAPAAHKHTRPCITCVRCCDRVGAQVGQQAGFASRRMWAEQPGRARRRELDPQHVSAPGAPHRLDMGGQIGVPLRAQESNHCPQVGGRAGAGQ